MSERHGSEPHDATPLATDDMLRLLAGHADDPAAELPGWQRALDAFDALDPDDLDDARALNDALDADPLLFFRRLPAPELDADELADVKRSVHELRRAKAIEAESAEPPSAAVRRRWLERARATGRSAWRSPMLRLAAALVAAVLSVSLLLPALSTSPASSPAISPADPAGALAAVNGSAGAVPAGSGALAEPMENLPLVENFSGDSELIQIETPDMSMVVVVAAADSIVADTGADRL